MSDTVSIHLEERRPPTGLRRFLRPAAAATAVYLGWRLARRLGEANLEGKVVLVTGGSRGLGLALAREFAEEGCRVVICARDRKELESAVEDLDLREAEGWAIRCDLTDRRQAARMVRRVTQHFGGIDVLVNNAGTVQVGPLNVMTAGDFREAMEDNFWGAVHATLETLPVMGGRGEGRIVNITSIGGKVPMPHLLPYDCAKFALVGFSEGLRAELAGRGITVTTVVPGLMRTGSPANAIFKGDPSSEYAWFSMATATSLTAMSARRAARRIVRATKRGEAEITLTWQAKVARLVHDLLPGATADVLGLVNRVLPAGGQAGEKARGMELDTPVSPSRLTVLVNRAARDLNQYGGRGKPSPAHAEAVGLGGRDGAAERQRR